MGRRLVINNIMGRGSSKIKNGGGSMKVLLSSVEVGKRVRLEFKDDDERKDEEDGVVVSNLVVVLDNGDCFNFEGEDIDVEVL